ncbi:MAG: hypothetical protein QXJ06_01705 [Candidatus Aenigmatarchaeota archaeon]
MSKIFEIINSSSSKKLGRKTNDVFKIIKNKWPINPLEVAKYLNEEGDVKILSAKYIYHFKKLEEKNLIRMKKIGNTYIAWPVEIEKLRIIHEITKEL